MTHDLLDLYSRASEWTLQKVKGAASGLDSDTPCERWNVRELMNHMLETQQYFVGSARRGSNGQDRASSNRAPHHDARDRSNRSAEIGHDRTTSDSRYDGRGQALTVQSDR